MPTCKRIFFLLSFVNSKTRIFSHLNIDTKLSPVHWNIFLISLSIALWIGKTTWGKFIFLLDRGRIFLSGAVWEMFEKTKTFSYSRVSNTDWQNQKRFWIRLKKLLAWFESCFQVLRVFLYNFKFFFNSKWFICSYSKKSVQSSINFPLWFKSARIFLHSKWYTRKNVMNLLLCCSTISVFFFNIFFPERKKRREN